VAEGMSLPIEKWIGGGAAHVQRFIGEFGPANRAQRKEFKKAAERMRTGAFGFTEGQQQQAAQAGRQGIAAQQAQQQADVARQQAAGMLQGGAGAEAQRQIAAQGQAAQGQLNAQVQQQSDAYAQQQYARDQAAIDAQAAKWRQLWADQANISMQTTGAGGVSAPAPSADARRNRKMDVVGGAAPETQQRPTQSTLYPWEE
jgi:hypothetical protein